MYLHITTSSEPTSQIAYYITQTSLSHTHTCVAVHVINHSQNNLASVFRQRGKHDDAEAMYLDALRIKKAALGLNHVDVALTARNLGNLYVDQDKYEQAEAMYRDALRIYKMVFGLEHFVVAETQVNLGALYFKKENYDRSEDMYREALRVYTVCISISLYLYNSLF
jgi:tetratricopeptide (TPR) repeat protein